LLHELNSFRTVAKTHSNAAHNADRLDLVMLVTRALVLYSLAEFHGGYASTIDVNVDATSFSVSDDGRGHAIARTINGLPYLPFIYTHLDYPFADADPPGQVQLQGIGMSLINAMCSELSVVVRKPHGTLRLRYEAGWLANETRDASQTTRPAPRCREPSTRFSRPALPMSAVLSDGCVVSLPRTVL
jgi:DNA gyrase/topoisomerase IV subunit B